MAKPRQKCQWCGGQLMENGDRIGRRTVVIGVRWYKCKNGYTHGGACAEMQWKKENAEPVFSAPRSIPFEPPRPHPK